MAKIYIEGNGWGLTIGRLNQLHGEPLGIHFWKIGRSPRMFIFNFPRSGGNFPPAIA